MEYKKIDENTLEVSNLVKQRISKDVLEAKKTQLQNLLTEIQKQLDLFEK